jgi:hypothetical protein
MEMKNPRFNKICSSWNGRMTTGYPGGAWLSGHGAAVNPYRDANSTLLDLVVMVEREGNDRCVDTVSVGWAGQEAPGAPGESHTRPPAFDEQG